MYLDVADSAALPYGWTRYAHFSLAIVNQVHSKYSVRKGKELLIHFSSNFLMSHDSNFCIIHISLFTEILFFEKLFGGI